MANLEEIIKPEKSRSDSRTFSQIPLFKEGAFLRAYEQSAWLMSRYAAVNIAKALEHNDCYDQNIDDITESDVGEKITEYSRKTCYKLFHHSPLS